MSDQISETVQPTETKLEGGKVEVATPAPESVLQGGAVEQGDASLQGGADDVDVLEGGKSKKKKRSDKGKKRGSYKHHSGNPSTKQRKYLMEMLTPGKQAYYRSSRRRCQRGSRRSKRYGTCVKDVKGKRANLIKYGVHRRSSGRLQSTKSRSGRKSKSPTKMAKKLVKEIVKEVKQEEGARRSGRARMGVKRLGF